MYKILYHIGNDIFHHALRLTYYYRPILIIHNINVTLRSTPGLSTLVSPLNTRLGLSKVPTYLPTHKIVLRLVTPPS